jgi:hypothetical protein
MTRTPSSPPIASIAIRGPAPTRFNSFGGVPSAYAPTAMISRPL